MPKVQIPKKSISLDMTAMCDVAFLLLTFFMLTTKFKPDEPVVVDTPSSTSEILMPETDMMTISIDNRGKVFFGIDGQDTRLQVIEKMAAEFRIPFTKEEKYEFSKLSAFGVPINKLPGFLKLSAYERGKFMKEGIPTDSLDNQLKRWIDISRREKRYRIAIKGDQKALYKSAKQVIGTLQELNINRFNLITTVENKPKINTH